MVFHKAFAKLNMSEVAQIEDLVMYSSFEKTIKIMITPTDTIDDLKTQLNTYFEYLGEKSIYMSHICSDALHRYERR